MLEVVDVIDSSSLSIEDKNNLKEFYLETSKIYIENLKKGIEPDEVCNIIYKNRFYTCSRVLKNLGINCSSRYDCPPLNLGDTLGGAISVHVTTVHVTTVTVPISLIELSSEEFAERIQGAIESVDKEVENEAETEQAKVFINIPRGEFTKDN